MSTNRPPVAIGFLGCGRVADHYASIIRSGVVEGFRFVGFCDLKADRAALFAKEFEAPAYHSAEEMFDRARPDVVFILTPSGYHYEHAKAALEAGLNVISEKPITMFPEQAMELANLARARGLMYGVIFQNRFNPAVQHLKATLDAGRFGKIISACMRLRWCRQQDYYEDGWHGTWAQDGGVINQQAIHHVDALNWLAGPVIRLQAMQANRVNRLEAEDTMVAALEFTGGALGTIEATTAARPEDFEASISILGDKGYAQIGGIALNRIEQWRFVESIAEDEYAAATHSREVPTGYGLSHGPLLQMIVDRLSDGRTDAPVSPLDGAATVALVHALYASIEQQRPVHLADHPRSNRLGHKRESKLGDRK